MEVLEQHRITELEHLRVGEAGIGHVSVHGVGAGKSRTRRGARTDRLVVLVPGVAEIEIVHRALGGGEAAQRAEQAVGHRLRCFHVAGDDRRGIFRRQDRLLRNDDVDRPQAARIHRDVVVDHDAKDIEHRRARDRFGRIEIGVLLRRGTAEIDGRLALLLVDADPDLDPGALVHLVCE